MVETTENDSVEDQAPFHPALTRKLLQSPSSAVVSAADGQQQSTSNKRITNEAIVAASEVLQIFVQEARHRAGIEAECEQEGRMVLGNEDDDDDEKASTKKPQVSASHIAKIAADMLLEFS